MQQTTSSVPRIAFFVILSIAILPLLLFPLVSVYFHAIHHTPQVQDGVLDLAGKELSPRQGLPLDGMWEFYYGRWIISGKGSASLGTDAPLAPVPRPWHTYPGLAHTHCGIGSYRIVLQNCPDGYELACHIPNINSSYRVYLNGTLITSRGSLDGEPSGWRNQQITQGLAVTAGQDAELVVEVSSRNIGGLYLTPLLVEYERYVNIAGLRSMFSSAFMGIIVVSIAVIASISLLRSKLFSSFALVSMDLLVFIRIVFQNEYLSFLNSFFFDNRYMVNTFLESVTLFLPVVFLLCAQKMVHIHIKRTTTLCTALYELILLPFLLWNALCGRPGWVLVCCVVSYLPFFYVMAVLYRSVQQRLPYSLLVSASLMLVLSSMIASSMYRSGLIVMNISLFPPGCFMIAMLLQLWIYIRNTFDLQREAVEAENLRLKLRESEISLRLSQIKPHFLYNTLIAIHVLCTQAPETAAETTLKFATFLRTNMNFINTRELIPFSRELEHIQNYTDIEQLRYQKRLTVRFEIESDGFTVPPLSIQPLVENAIRHGACKNVKGGTVILHTYESQSDFWVEICDDGPGFDCAATLQNLQGTHGLQNILFRLREQRGACVEIQSSPDAGTCVRVRLPKDGYA